MGELEVNRSLSTGEGGERRLKEAESEWEEGEGGGLGGGRKGGRAGAKAEEGGEGQRQGGGEGQRPTFRTLCHPDA